MSVLERKINGLVIRIDRDSYEKRLEAQVKHWHLPRHIGIIMDGNRRYARTGGAQVSWGHARGADKLQQVLSWCYEAEIPVVTVWSFSLDNFQRETSEVAALLKLFEHRTRELVTRSEVHENGVRVRYIGKLDLLSESLREAIRHVETAGSGSKPPTTKRVGEELASSRIP